VVENETFSQGLVKQRQKHKRIGRIVNVDDVEAMPNEDEERQEQRGHERPAVLPQVTEEALGR